MIIPVFLMNRGCPHRCIFCNQAMTAGENPAGITAAALDETIRTYLGDKRREEAVQIAFYGGTFTGMPPGEQRRLLEMTAPYLKEGTVSGIRLSTRPDEIDAEGLALLTAHGVTTVEIGVQSLDDKVLHLAGRGHTEADASHAIVLLREKGFETIIHLMVGLPGDSHESFTETIDKAIALHPDGVRLHPTLVFKDTPLAMAFQKGEYTPLPLAQAVLWCKEALLKLTVAGIPVIRLGLQTTREMEEPGAVVAGPFHPAFRSLVEASVFLEMASALLTAAGGIACKTGENGGEAHFILSAADMTYFFGLKKKNVASLKITFKLDKIHVTVDPSLPRRNLILAQEGQCFQTDFSGRIRVLHNEGLYL